MLKRTIITAISVVSIFSCGTTALTRSEMAEVDSGKKAIVRTYNQPILAGMIFGDQPVARILYADGVKDVALLKLDDKYVIDVGLRSITVSCSHRARYDKRNVASEILKLDVKPFHEYLIRCSFDSAYGPGGTYSTSFSAKEKRLKYVQKAR